MKHFLKGISGVGSALLGVGVALLLAGLIMGGRPQVRFAWSKGPTLAMSAASASSGAGAGTGAGRSSAADSKVSGEVKNLVLDVSAATVNFETGDAFSVSSGSDLAVDNVLQNGTGTWRISSRDGSGAGPERDLTVTLPADAQFDSITLKLGAGTINADGLVCKSADLSVDAGTLNLERFTCTNGATLQVGLGTLNLDGTLTGKCALNCGLGTLNLDLSAPGAYGYTVECGMGSVNVDGQKYTGLAHEVSVNADADTCYAIQCGLGTVSLSL